MHIVMFVANSATANLRRTIYFGRYGLKIVAVRMMFIIHFGKTVDLPRGNFGQMKQAVHSQKGRPVLRLEKLIRLVLEVIGR